ncbi:MAG TPA: monovalent cation/H(+) antiporter subunit G [Acidimicrobiia bacterium]|nr:monovalent cation/H(+) antiporter subunit G [Acidimicrobiia bacterium]
MKEAVAATLLAVGLVFSLSGAVGIVRMPDVYTRLQCSTKNITLGALPVLIALAVAKGLGSTYAARALVVALLLMVVSPLASHVLSRAAYKAGVPLWDGSVADQAAERKRP